MGMMVAGAPHSIPQGDNDLILQNYYISVCHHCNKPSFWEKTKIFHPTNGACEPPNPDLEEEIQTDYLEAASVCERSPRAAAALLRLCIQKLCRQLGLPAQNINDDIATLVSQGLNPDIQQALDIVRVVGNSAVHPLEIDIKDDRQTASTLFSIVNFIAEQMISFPAKREKIFANFPDGVRNQINRRNGM